MRPAGLLRHEGSATSTPAARVAPDTDGTLDPSRPDLPYPRCMTWMLRIARFLVVGAVLLVAALVATVVVDRAVSRGTVASLTNVTMPGVAGDVLAYRADPEGPGPHPTVVMIHEFWGLRPSIVEKADALAELGYVVVAPDSFRGTSVRWLPAAIWNVVSTPPGNVDADLRAVVDTLAMDPSIDADAIVVMGFCFGGGAALRYATIDERIAAVADFYGALIFEPERLARIRGPLLAVFGDQDPQFPADDIAAFDRALTEAGVDHDIEVFAGEGHAFVAGIEAIQAGGNAGAAWDMFVRWLENAVADVRAEQM